MKMSDFPASVRKMFRPKGAPVPLQRTKYGSRKTVVGSRVFDSAKEARRYGDLLLMLAAGRIADLRLQVAYRIEVKGLLVCSYIADFTYYTAPPAPALSIFVVEDVKSAATRKNRAYRIKVKLMKAVHGITIKEV